MVAPVFEHITAMMVVSMLFVSAVIAVPAISYVNLLYVDQQQFRNVALEALNSMLLGMGYPSEWGSSDLFNESDVTQFGLALSESSSFYVLDPDKVQRLDVDNPSGSLDYETVRTLLGLQDYGFNIKIIPPFSVTVIDNSEISSLLFEVNVTFNDGRPIPGAHVEATILYVNNTGGPYIAEMENSTNWLGQCTIENEPTSDVTDYIVVLKTTVADLATITSSYMAGFHQNVANASIVGENITMWIPEEHLPGDPQSSRWITNIVVVSEDEVWNLYDYDGTKTNDYKINTGEGYAYWNKLYPGLNYYDPLFIIFTIWVSLGSGEGREFVLFAGPYTTASGYRVFDFGSSVRSPSGVALKLSRSVEIADMSYIFELLIWKEV